MKKIFYVPGLISALLIPILFWYYGSQKFKEVNLGVIDIGLPAKSHDGKELAYASFEPYRNWNYHKIIVQPSLAKENSKFYVSEIKKLQKENREKSGIEFILDNKNTYNDIVSLLNDMELSKHPSYHLDLDKTGHFFVVQESSISNIPTYNDDTIDRCGNEVIDFSSEQFKISLLKGFSKFEYQLTQLPEPSFYIIFGFLLFINISMLSIKERFQLQKFHS
ncbi:hypothetical protein [Chryseobacterium taiwanense]|uniref:Uncharacterized protein n=1 Tax=Chryseobacterium taiwanense TaxID=363331 RepID=A0A0B4DCD2_9FLAO|nr:hypothetical protein [Chryseobacterium taiwanense]KIC64336.1 hypothetical protein RM51_06405 [Chryseobacterium taiwanense]